MDTMELKKTKKKEKELLLEVGGESSTLTNALREHLWEDSNVSEAAHIKEHPYLSQPKIFVKTTRGEHESALEKASENLAEQAREFKQKFKSALK